MSDLTKVLTKIRRPKLLLQAARDLAGSNLRDHSQSYAGYGHPDGPLFGLLDLEASLDEKRRLNQADYSVQQHIEILATLLGACRAGAGADT